MNDNDLIRRGDALRAAVGWLFDAKRTEDLVERLRSVPAAELEMTAREFLHAHSRMCETYPAYGNDPGCKGCPLEYDRSCDLMRRDLADHFIDVVEKWAREHPEGGEG